jgi:CBS domain-containing protein
LRILRAAIGAPPCHLVHQVVAIEPSASLAEAAKRMREANVGILPVVEDGQIRGVITDRDLVVRAIAQDADLTSTPVGDCATTDPIVAHPEWDVDKAMEAMAHAQVGRLPVVKNGNKLAGIVTLGSLALRAKKDTETLQAAREVSRRSGKATGTRAESASAPRRPVRRVRKGSR